MKLRLARRAEVHLCEIRDYTHENFGEHQWLIYSGALETAFSTLQRFPEIGIDHSSLPDAYRAFRVHEHWICYRIADDSIEVVGVVRDLDSMLDR